jgi:hypothetical protein
VYQPLSGAFTVTLVPGSYQYEWLNPAINSIASSGTLPDSNVSQSFSPPFSGDAVLYLRASALRDTNH